MRVPIRKESRGVVLGGLTFSLSLLALGHRSLKKYAFAALGASSALAWALRDPERDIIPIEGGVLSPADGTVARIETVDEDFRKLTIAIGLGDCLVLRAPVSGTATAADGAAKFTGDPEVLLRPADGDTPSVRFDQGARFGSVHCPSTRVEITIPTSQRLMVNVGDCVVAGITALSGAN